MHSYIPETNGFEYSYFKVMIGNISVHMFVCVLCVTIILYTNKVQKPFVFGFWEAIKDSITQSLVYTTKWKGE